MVSLSLLLLADPAAAVAELVVLLAACSPLLPELLVLAVERGDC